jgi:predicted RNA-binding protein with PIN domain
MFIKGNEMLLNVEYMVSFFIREKQVGGVKSWTVCSSDNNGEVYVMTNGTSKEQADELLDELHTYIMEMQTMEAPEVVTKKVKPKLFCLDKKGG